MTADPSTGVVVTADLSSIGGSATQSFAAGTNNVFTYVATVAPGTTPGARSLPVSVTDAQGRSTTTTIDLTVLTPTNPTASGIAVPDTVLPGEVTALTVTVTPGQNPTSSGIAVSADLSSIGGAANQPFADDGDNTFSFVATVSPNAAGGPRSLPVTVTDAQGRTASTTISLTVSTRITAVGAADPSTVLDGNSTHLTVTVQPGTFPDSTGIAVTADLSSIGGSSAQTFAAGSNNVFSFDATVAAGTAPGLKTLSVSVSDAQGRSASTAIQLTVSSRPTAVGSANPSTVIAGQTTVLTVTVTPGQSPTSSGVTVVADLRSIGGSAAQPFAAAGNFVFTYTATVAANTLAGSKNLPVSVSDAQGRTASTSIALVVVENTILIGAIQGTGNVSPRAGQTVTTRGVVTQLGTGGFWIQDFGDGDPASSDGIFVAGSASVQVGHRVEVTATVAEVNTVTTLTGGSVATLATGDPLPAAASLMPPDTSLADAAVYFERHEGMRVQVDDAVAVSPSRDSSAGRDIVVLADDGSSSTPRTARGGLLIAPGDANSERIFLTGPTNRLPSVDVSDHFATAPAGVVDFDRSAYRVRVGAVVAAVSAGLDRETVVAAASDQIAIATLDVPAGADLYAVAEVVVQDLKTPDVLVVIGSTSGLIAAIEGRGGPRYKDAGNGLLYQSLRGMIRDGEQTFAFKGKRFTVIPAHFIDPVKAAQLRDRVAAILAADPRAAVIVAGRLNATEFSPPLLTLMDAPLFALVETLEPDERYTHVVAGVSQALDHMLGSPRVVDELLIAYDVVHIDAEFAQHIGDGDPVTARISFQKGQTRVQEASYWRRNLDAWPVSSLVLGDTRYGKSALKQLLGGSSSDASVVLARELIATELNLAAGTNPRHIGWVVAAADKWLVANGASLPYGTHPKSHAGREARALADLLERFNDGR